MFAKTMKSRRRTILWVLYVVGCLSPIVALFIKPAHYSFCMFFPATPDTALGRFRLVAGDSVLVGGFVVALASAIALTVLAKGRERLVAFLSLVLSAAHPLQQPIFLEDLDTYLNDRLRDRAEGCQIVGKSREDLLRIFGTPSSTRANTWEYQPLPLYWMGSRFQVFFENGVVRGFEANDD